MTSASSFTALLLMACLTVETNANDAVPADELLSPDKRSSVRILHSALPGSDPYEGFFTIAVRREKRVVAQYPTEGYLLEALWSPDGKYVAVDNRRANSGDYLWLFRLSDGLAIRKPIDAPTGHSGEAYTDYVQKLVRRVTRRFPVLTDDEFRKLFTFAHGWTKAGELQVKTNFAFRNFPNRIVYVLDTYKISGTKLILVSEKVEKELWPPKHQ